MGDVRTKIQDTGLQMTGGLAPYKGVFGTAERLHLLRRTLFGVTQSDLEHFQHHSLDHLVDELLNPAPFDHPLPVNDYDTIGIHMPFGATWIGKPYSDADDDALRILSFMKWSMGVLVKQDRSIREKMLLFWHNHFATQANIGRSNLIWSHYQLLRSNALGNVKDIARSVTIDAHMLRYLNGEDNTAAAPNENYARELQELFCIGKGRDAHYTEADVRQAAKVLTGWKVDLENDRTYFKATDHDTSDKKFSSFYGNRVIKGRSGERAGEEELNDLLEMLFAQPEAARFICRKLYRWFVYYRIDEQVEEKLIRPLALLLQKSRFEIKPVMKALLTSEHFFDAQLRGAQLKSPIDFCIGLQRVFSVPVTLQESYATNYSFLHHLINECQLMGQVYTDPPNVSGWPAYYQEPGFYKLWINSSTYPKRNEFSATLIDFGFNREGKMFAANITAFARQCPNAGDPDQLIQHTIGLLYAVPVSDASLKELKKNTLLSGQAGDHYWTEAWESYLAQPENETAKLQVESRLKNLFRYLVNSPEFQLS